MNTVMKIFLSMSFSGGLLILALLLGKRFLKDKISRQWQYYIWLIVIFRLLLPFGPETNLLGKTYQAADHAITRAAPLPQQQPPLNAPEDSLVPAGNRGQDNGNADSPAEDMTTVHPFRDLGALFIHRIWLVWLIAALGLLLRKATIYQSFTRYVSAGSTPVSDIEILDRLSVAAERTCIKKPIEISVNPLISSPLLTGFFHPCIVLPSADISEKYFQYIILHELTHYKRRDMFYKWLVQVTVCLHWFNPLVHLMSREITKACEFSCDEAVLAKTGRGHAQDYGKTLLDTMAAVGKYKENHGAVTLSENKQLLKERLGAIMSFKKRSTATRFFTGMLTLCIIFGAAFVGVYPVAAASNQTTVKNSTEEEQAQGKDFSSQTEQTHSKDFSSRAEQYYEAGSLPLFPIAFSRLDETEQEEWLGRIYADNNIAFASAVINLLDKDCAFIQRFAEKAYEDSYIAFFSALIVQMSEDTLEIWLDKALEDGNYAFQTILFHALDRDDEFDELEEKREKEWAEAQIAEYEAVGVTMIDSKNYYYQGELVNIFLDIRSNKSFYTLNMNLAGTVNIKIIRNADNEITGVAYMTDEEVLELFGDEENR